MQVLLHSLIFLLFATEPPDVTRLSAVETGLLLGRVALATESANRHYQGIDFLLLLLCGDLGLDPEQLGQDLIKGRVVVRSLQLQDLHSMIIHAL